MKYNFWALLVFFLIQISTYSQEPVKGNNAILVKGVSFKSVKESLLDSGIFIDQQDEEDGTIITKRKGYCECPNKEFYQLIYYIRVKDSLATIRGRFSQQVQLKIASTILPRDEREDFTEAIFWKSKMSAYNYIFNIMIDFANSLNPLSVEYKTL
jgi:hypothetical protein